MDKNLDIIGVVETWLTEEHQMGEISIPGYRIIRRDRNEIRLQRGGGLLLYVRDGLFCKKTMEYEKYKCEGIVCEVGCNENNTF